jgi:hypothetical protein
MKMGTKGKHVGFFMLAVVAVVLFGVGIAGAAEALCPTPSGCPGCEDSTLVYPPTCCEAGGYTITAYGPTYTTNPSYCGESTCYLWEYIITTSNKFNLVNRLSFFIPSTYNQEVEVLNGSPISSRIPYQYEELCNGAGLVGTAYGTGICNGRVLTVGTENVEGGKRAWFTTKDAKEGLISSLALSALGLPLGVCKSYDCNGETVVGGIKGPGFAFASLAPTIDVTHYSKEMCKEVVGVRTCTTCKFDLIAENGVLKDIDVKGGECYTDESDPKPISQLGMGGGSAEYLPDGIFAYSASPGTYCGTIGGKYKCIKY